MSGILMMIIAIVVLGGAYLLYGRYLQNKYRRRRVLRRRVHSGADNEIHSLR